MSWCYIIDIISLKAVINGCKFSNNPMQSNIYVAFWQVGGLKGGSGKKASPPKKKNKSCYQYSIVVVNIVSKVLFILKLIFEL